MAALDISLPTAIRMAAVILTGHLLAAGPAAAQTDQPPTGVDEAPPVTGPANDSGDIEFPSWRLPAWSFTPSVAIGMVYDSNVTLTSPRASIGSSQGDWLFSVTPAGRLRYGGKRSTFSLGYSGWLRRHLDIDGLDAFSQRATATFRRAMTRRWSLSAHNSYADAPTTDEVEVNGVPFRRNGSRTNVAGASTSVRLSRLTTLAARYDLTWVSFDRQEEALVGGWIHGIRTDVGHLVSSRLSLGGEYGFRTAAMDEDRRRLSFQDVGAVAKYDIASHTRATASAGFATLHDRNIDDTHSGPYMRLGIVQQLPLVQIGGSFERQYVPSFGFGGASSSRQIRGYAQGPLGLRRLFGQASITWRHTNPFRESTLEADTVWLRTTISYVSTPWSRVEGFYTYALQDTIITGGEADRHRVGFQVVISQPMRLR